MRIRSKGYNKAPLTSNAVIRISDGYPGLLKLFVVVVRSLGPSVDLMVRHLKPILLMKASTLSSVSGRLQNIRSLRNPSTSQKKEDRFKMVQDTAFFKNLRRWKSRYGEVTPSFVDE